MKSPENVEQRLTIIFAVVSILALGINLVAIEGISWSGFLNSIQSLSGLFITVVVFFVASRIASSMGYKDFKKIFEGYLKDWVQQNRYLIDDDKKIEGQEGKEFYFMLTKAHHPNFLKPDAKPARDFERGSGRGWHKGAFIYCDHRKEEVIVFGLNKSFFTKSGGDLPYGFTDLPQIAELVRHGIKKQFDDMVSFTESTSSRELLIQISPDGKRLSLSLKNLANTQENAKLLIDIVEYVKTAILAIA
jgi:hypothetical protein